MDLTIDELEIAEFMATLSLKEQDKIWKKVDDEFKMYELESKEYAKKKRKLKSKKQKRRKN